MNVTVKREWSGDSNEPKCEQNDRNRPEHPGSFSGLHGLGAEIQILKIRIEVRSASDYSKNTALEGNRGREGRLNHLDTRHNNEKINLINTAVYPVITLAHLGLFL